MPCDGNCTFVETLTLKLNASGDVIEFEWESAKSSTDDCVADIEDGQGWFRFQRSTDADVEDIDRKRIEDSDTGTSPISGGDLPSGVEVGATSTDFIGIKVTASSGAHFTTIDLFFAHQIKCSCGGNDNEKEIVIRFTFTAGGTPSVRKKGGNKSSTDNPGGGGKTITYEWTETLDCKTNALDQPTYLILKRWKELDKKRKGGTISKPEEEELEGIEEDFKEEDKNLEEDELAMGEPEQQIERDHAMVKGSIMKRSV